MFKSFRIVLFFGFAALLLSQSPTVLGQSKTASESDGTKGTIGMVCFTVEKGERLTWLASATSLEPTKEFTGCMDEVMKHFRELREMENGKDFGEKMSKWFMTSYKSYVSMGELMGCQRDLKEEWKRKLLETPPKRETPKEEPKK